MTISEKSGRKPCLEVSTGIRDTKIWGRGNGPMGGSNSHALIVERTAEEGVAGWPAASCHDSKKFIRAALLSRHAASEFDSGCDTALVRRLNGAGKVY